MTAIIYFVRARGFGDLFHEIIYNSSPVSV